MVVVMMMAAQLDEAEPLKPYWWTGPSTKVAKDPNNKKEAAQGPDFTVMALWLYMLCPAENQQQHLPRRMHSPVPPSP